VLSADLEAYLPERFTLRTRKRLFDMLAAWCEDGSVCQSTEGAGFVDYRREVDKFKMAQSLKMRESQDRMALDRELADQVGHPQPTRAGMLTQLFLETGTVDSVHPTVLVHLFTQAASAPAVRGGVAVVGCSLAWGFIRILQHCSCRASDGYHSDFCCVHVLPCPAVQVECIQWAATHAMAALLCGACFDDNVRKMNGRVMLWIHGLFTGTSERVPMGGNYSPVDPRTPSPHVRTGSYAQSVMASSVYGSTSTLPRARSALSGHYSATSRSGVARTALLTLLLTNPDMFPTCIDQCYSSDSAIADGYFGVLAEVRARAPGTAEELYPALVAGRGELWPKR
jgi:hypothetical protein